MGIIKKFIMYIVRLVRFDRFILYIVREGIRDGSIDAGYLVDGITTNKKYEVDMDSEEVIVDMSNSVRVNGNLYVRGGVYAKDDLWAYSSDSRMFKRV